MQWRKAHFIGIGGVGMSATARLLKESGVSVSGSDEGVYEPVRSFLEREGISWSTPYAAKNIPEDADLIVIGKNAKLVSDSNEEVAAAHARGTQILSFPEVLGALSGEKTTIVVAGSYGKSTSAALLAHCLESAGKDPSYFIGAIPFTPATNARIGRRDLFVMEGDEYPSSNTDTRSKFLHLHAAHILVTPLAHDHVNIFPTEESYLQPFIELEKSLPKDGTITMCVEGPLSDAFQAHTSHPVTTYGVHAGEFQATDIVWGEKTSFSVTRHDERVFSTSTENLGEHNIQNCVGVAAFLLSHDLLTPEEIASGIASFKGVRRRLEKLSKQSSVPCYEGFGSSDAKARSAIEAVRLHFPDRRLVVIFEPHTFSWRNRSSIHWYDSTFKGVDEMLVYHPAEQGATTHAQLSHKEIVDRLNSAGIKASAVATPDETMQKLAGEVKPHDVVLILTSGDMDGLLRKIPEWLDAAFS